MTDPAESLSSPVILLLAAGEGRRYGGIKQLADIQGEPMVRRAARAALGHGVPVVVVLGAHAEQVGPCSTTCLYGLPASTVGCKVWAVHSPPAFVTCTQTIRKFLRLSCVWPISRCWEPRIFVRCCSATHRPRNDCW